MRLTRESWIESHPYLEPVARFEAAVEALVRELPRPGLPAPAWEAYEREYAAGVPLLASGAAGPALLSAAAGTLALLAERAAEAPLPEPFRASARAVRDRFRAGSDAARAALEWVSGRGGEPPPEAGALRFLAWTAIAHALAPSVAAYARWREERPWGRGLCPTCGSAPAISQLAPGHGDSGKQRRLVCACCGTRWAARRLGCPHCGGEDGGALGILAAEEEAGLRLEVCGSCRGYVKTWVGADGESFLLSDWATLHLDAAAAERGYRRAGAGLYAL